MTQNEWLELAALMADLWSHAPPEPAVVQAYGQQLHDLPAAAVRLALQAARADHAFLPPARDLRELVHGPPRGWEAALTELYQAINAVGAYGTPPGFDDPALSQVAADRGWRDLCLAVYTDSTWRAQFRDAYQAAQRVHVLTGQRQLAGLDAGQNQPRLTSAASTVHALPDGSPQIAAPTGEVENLEASPTDAPQPSSPELSVEDARRQLAKAFDLNSALDEREVQQLEIDDPRIPDTPQVRRTRAHRARRKVDDMLEQHVEQETEQLRDPARLRRLEQLTADIHTGAPEPGPPAWLDARVDQVLDGHLTPTQLASQLRLPVSRVVDWVKLAGRRRSAAAEAAAHATAAVKPAGQDVA